jgi:hypothetical protein
VPIDHQHVISSANVNARFAKHHQHNTLFIIKCIHLLKLAFHAYIQMTFAPVCVFIEIQLSRERETRSPREQQLGRLGDSTFLNKLQIASGAKDAVRGTNKQMRETKWWQYNSAFVIMRFAATADDQSADKLFCNVTRVFCLYLHTLLFTHNGNREKLLSSTSHYKSVRRIMILQAA